MFSNDATFFCDLGKKNRNFGEAEVIHETLNKKLRSENFSGNKTKGRVSVDQNATKHFATQEFLVPFGRRNSEERLGE